MHTNTQLDCTASDTNIAANASTNSQDVSLSRDMLNTLLNSINDLKYSVGALQESVSKLQYENEDLREELESTKTDLVILRENSGVKFIQFSKLPVELRR
jgi:regulator of replication initiation timing